MAIFIKEPGNKIITIPLIIIVIVLIISLFIVYYLFLIPAPIIELNNDGFNAANAFAGADFNLDIIDNSPIFKMLQQEPVVQDPSINIVTPNTNLFQSF